MNRRKLRIGFDARPLLHRSTGIGRYAWSLLPRLISLRPYDWFLYSDRPLPGTAALDVKQVRHAGRLLGAVGAMASQICFPRWAKADDLDVFWSPRHHIPLTMSLPTVVTIHDMVWKTHPETMARFGQTIERHLTPLSISKATNIIAVSQFTADQISEWYPAAEPKLSVVYEASVYTQDQPSPMSSDRNLLFVGTLEPRKNLPRALQGYRLARDRGVRDRLTIIGNQGWETTDLKKLAFELGIDDHVEFIGNLDDAGVMQHYARCRAVFLPSLTEGFGLPLVEAFAFSKPVVFANTGALPEIAGDAGIPVDPTSVQSIADGLVRVACDARSYAHLVGRARARSQHLSWDVAAEQTMSILERSTKGPARNAHAP